MTLLNRSGLRSEAAFSRSARADPGTDDPPAGIDQRSSPLDTMHFYPFFSRNSAR